MDKKIQFLSDVLNATFIFNNDGSYEPSEDAFSNETSLLYKNPFSQQEYDVTVYQNFYTNEIEQIDISEQNSFDNDVFSYQKDDVMFSNLVKKVKPELKDISIKEIVFYVSDPEGALKYPIDDDEEIRLELTLPRVMRYTDTDHAFFEVENYEHSIFLTGKEFKELQQLNFNNDVFLLNILREASDDTNGDTRFAYVAAGRGLLDLSGELKPFLLNQLKEKFRKCCM